MSSIDDRESLAAQEVGFLAAAEACLRHWEDALPIDVAQEQEIKFRVCFPLVAHSLNQVNASLMLLRSGQHFVAIANARVAFEHALTAQWVLLTRDGERQLVKHMDASYRTQAGEFSRAMGDPPELKDIVGRPPAEGRARSYSMPLVCSRFERAGLLYNLYRRLGQSTHPSLETLKALHKCLRT